MKKDALKELEAIMMKEVVRRRALGGYSMEAEGVLVLSETMYKMLQHMIETYPERGHDRDESTPRSDRSGRGHPKRNNKLAE